MSYIKLFRLKILSFCQCDWKIDRKDRSLVYLSVILKTEFYQSEGQERPVYRHCLWYYQAASSFTYGGYYNPKVSSTTDILTICECSRKSVNFHAGTFVHCCNYFLCSRTIIVY